MSYDIVVPREAMTINQWCQHCQARGLKNSYQCYTNKPVIVLINSHSLITTDFAEYDEPRCHSD